MRTTVSLRSLPIASHQTNSLRGDPAGMPYRHTLIFDDSLNMLWKDYADRAVVDYWYNSTVKGSAQGCAAAMRIDLQAGGSLRLHTDLAFRSDHTALNVQFWVRGLSAQFDGSRCDSSGVARHYTMRPSGWHCVGAVCLALWRSWGGQSAVHMVPLCSLAQVDRHGWHKVSVPASAFAPSFGEAFDEVTNRRLELCNWIRVRHLHYPSYYAFNVPGLPTLGLYQPRALRTADSNAPLDDPQAATVWCCIGVKWLQ